MTTRSAFSPGMPCWADVSTSDPAGSREFYAGLFGWRYETGSGYYVIALLDDVPVAALSGVAARADQRIAWTPYLASANVDKTAIAIGEHGGRVLHGPMKVPGSGSMVLGADPTGGTIGFWQPGGRWRCRLFEPGALWWAELYTGQPAAADEFYGGLFGYGQQQFGTRGDYAVWSLEGTPYLGRTTLDAAATADPVPHWMVYFVAPAGRGADATAARAAELGGGVRVEPFDHSHGRAAVLTDPSGAAFTVIDPVRPGS